MTMHLFQFLPVGRIMTSFSFAARFDFEWMTPPVSLGSDCSYMSRHVVQMDGRDCVQ